MTERPMPGVEAAPQPRAERRPHTDVYHGVAVEDPYHWLRERDDPAVRAYLEAENAYTAARTARLQPLQDALYAEMLGRIQQTDLSVPVRRGDYYYYSRTVEGMQYPVHCRRAAD
ncbi:MAG: oligopeptidase B, partial [Terriglobales bacterium]